MVEPGVSLLHNMSCCSTTVISHKGRAVGGLKPVVFALPASNRFATAASILRTLRGEKKKSGNPTEELRALLHSHALTIPYPAAALVQMEGVHPDTSSEPNLLTICAVLSKANERLYLRDKEPNIANIRPRRRIALLIPGGLL
jgi:hypothetical protein